MSYLHLPRLHFAGQFQADPSTVNNYPGNFDADEFQADYSQLTGDWGDSWNPRGTGSFRFRDCWVMAVVYADGTTERDPQKDPIIGLPIVNSGERVAGKIVDLDSQQQMVSEIWGFQVGLGGTSNRFMGDFKPAAFSDIWLRCPGSQINANFGASYQSVLQLSEWATTGSSRFLRELAERYPNNTPDRLSIKFNVDGHNSDSTTADFSFGRVTGTIGAFLDGEPTHFSAARQLAVSTDKPFLNTAYALVENDLIHLDLGNSIPTASTGGPLQKSKPLSLTCVAGNGAVSLVDIDYPAETWYETTAGVVSLRIQPEKVQLAATAPLSLQPDQSGDAGGGIREAPDGLFLRADQFVFRLNPGESANIRFYAFRFGVACGGQDISLAADTSFMTGIPFQLGLPAEALPIPAHLITNPKGFADLAITASDPGTPRRFIDGQLYGIGYASGTTPPAPASTPLPINILVFSGYSVPDQPNWIEHIEPIFSRYAALYPIMKPIVDLGNFSSVVQRSYILRNVFNLPVTNPNYMPVTRDLSEGKRQLIRKWLDNPLYMNLDSREDLMQALQQAIELEHATIPPYLTALYSIKPGLNTEAAALIRSVVLEEMLHMALVSNILISIGGSPQISKRRFVPVYPGSLPGGLRLGLMVRLRKCSVEHLRECFMAIEEPEELISIKRAQFVTEALKPTTKYTIGWFYDEILAALKKLSLSKEISFGRQDKQVCEWSGTGKLFPIGSLEDAQKAIQEIKDQGEGNARKPDDDFQELAHYYKFAEIVEGRHLVRKDGQYSYSGAPIAFDTTAVWPMVDDPANARYPQGSRAAILNEQFNQTYRALLSALHRAFNGEPAFIKDAIGVMFSLETQAQELMRTPSGVGDGTTAGPSFEF